MGASADKLAKAEEFASRIIRGFHLRQQLAVALDQLQAQADEIRRLCARLESLPEVLEEYAGVPEDVVAKPTRLDQAISAYRRPFSYPADLTADEVRQVALATFGLELDEIAELMETSGDSLRAAEDLRWQKDKSNAAREMSRLEDQLAFARNAAAHVEALLSVPGDEPLDYTGSEENTGSWQVTYRNELDFLRGRVRDLEARIECIRALLVPQG